MPYPISTVCHDGSSERFHLREFADGGAIGCLAPPGEDPRLSRVKMNERLQASRARKVRMGERCHREYPCVVRAPESGSLPYLRFPGSGFMMIDGDLGRAHYPQAWASGFLPLIPNGRLARFINDPDDRLLQVDFTGCSESQLTRVATTYLDILHFGWRDGIVPAARRPQDLQFILSSMGVHIPSRRIRFLLLPEYHGLPRAGDPLTDNIRRSFWSVLAPWLRVKLTSKEAADPCLGY